MTILWGVILPFTMVAQEAPIQLPLTERNGFFLTIGSLDSDSDLMFLWDTGSNFSAIDKSFLVERGIIASDPVRIGVGSFEHDFAIWDLKVLRRVLGVQALIGTDFLGDYAVSFLFQEGKLLVTQTAIAVPNFEFEIVNGLPILNISLNGVPTKALIDTGQNSAIVIVDDTGFPPRATVDYIGLSAEMADQSYFDQHSLAVANLQVLGESYSNLMVDELHRPQSQYSVVLGAGFFAGGSLALDFRSQRGSWKRNSGIQVAHIILPFGSIVVGDQLEITKLLVPQDENPFRMGDQIVGINGHPIHTNQQLLAIANESDQSTLLVKRDEQYLVIVIKPKRVEDIAP